MVAEKVRVLIKRCRKDNDLPLPSFATRGSSGMDLPACILNDLEIPPGERRIIPTGFAIALPFGYEAQIRPRSGMASKFGLTMANSPGTIDSDYRGEIKVIAINLGEETVLIRRGDKIGQMVISKIPEIELVQVEELPDTDRGEGGFGHSG
jgi:dUTP pyrophosphatase